MLRRITYTVGRLTGRHPVAMACIGLAGIAVTITTLISTGSGDNAAKSAQTAADPGRSSRPPSEVTPLQRCEARRDVFRTALRVGQGQQARAIADECAEIYRSDKELAPLLAEVDAAVKREAAAEAKRRKSQGVSIGMTKEDVLASSWGRPQRINSTTTARGTEEQWVYRGGYLYFDANGRLRTIQH